MRAVIFTGGRIEDYEPLKKYVKQEDLIICADSGIHHALKMGVIPHLVVGDMDSVTEEDRGKICEYNIKLYTFPKEKDFTDTELALEAALKKGVREAVLLGGLGDRPDHSLANIFLMVNFKKKGIDLMLAGVNWEMFIIDGVREIEGKRGQILSLIPLTPEVRGIKTAGLYYPLRGETIPMGASRGISNVFTEDRAVVKVEQGLLLAVKVLGC
ncbi:thiamine diphosphokinase [Thermosediminibacter oceani]|uniref:Thiamine diphosphokinase n=1 Tax=Thermosediminibacter oceani (strain ATCC BAA-1034 / DSM 16646 / JW/IW-1228P) TaxID=555079 RepID=D9S2G3_THEOJ|nr:thiamine diphosphokinase [Thermosediminibacter oceani]ADL07590.1 thiamine pyrophosphokinase [Thermosediminibacter oceani DSM 16646]